MKFCLLHHQSLHISTFFTYYLLCNKLRVFPYRRNMVQKSESQLIMIYGNKSKAFPPFRYSSFPSRISIIYSIFSAFNYYHPEIEAMQLCDGLQLSSAFVFGSFQCKKNEISELDLIIICQSIIISTSEICNQEGLSVREIGNGNSLIWKNIGGDGVSMVMYRYVYTCQFIFKYINNLIEFSRA